MVATWARRLTRWRNAPLPCQRIDAYLHRDASLVQRCRHGRCIWRFDSHTYDMRQSQEDQATVPIFYEPRQVKLHLNSKDVDAELGEIVSTTDTGIDNLERRKSQWAALAKAAGSKGRMEELAADLLEHFLDRCKTLDGKAMTVCMTRENCVRLYEALSADPNCPEMKIIMTGNLSKDPPAWSEAGHITTKKQRDSIKTRMVDPDDPLKIVIVCDMWLTGPDIPCLHTLYIDKPMKGHNMIQAISRVNRIFSDKPHGLIVDYIGIGDDLRDATNTYTAGGGRGEPAPDVSTEAVPVFMDCLAVVRGMLPDGIDYGDWRTLSGIELEDRFALIFGTLTDDDERRDGYLSQVEQGKYDPPTAESAARIAELFSEDPDEWIGYAGRVPEDIQDVVRKASPQMLGLIRSISRLSNRQVLDLKADVKRLAHKN